MRAPPLLVSFNDITGFLKACDARISEEEQDAAKLLVSRGLPPGVSTIAIAVLFGYSTKFVGAMRKAPNRYYRRFQIPKGSGGVREINAPKVALKVVQKWFGYHLARATGAKPSVHGFVPQRSVVTAARVHTGARWMASLDIRDFFPSVDRTRVDHVLARIGYPKHSREVLSDLLTLNGRLPQGSPASPVLANLAFEDTDEALAALAHNCGGRYTRYADDLVFSGTANAPDKFIAKAVNVVTSFGWQVATDKSSLAAWPQRMAVHGILTNSSAPRLPKEYRNTLRAMKYRVLRGDIDEATMQRFRGHLAYAHSVESLASWLPPDND